MTDQCTVDVWTLHLKASAKELQAAQRLLSAEELARVKRLVFPAHRVQAILALAQRRKILADYVNQPPESLIFSTGTHGKPFIADYCVHFNISHSHELALLAISNDAEVGIDIEYWKPRVNIEGLIRKVFTVNEQKTYFALEESQRKASFYQVWTAKEAFVKALGKGLYHSLTAIEVEVNPTLPTKLLYTSDKNFELNNYTVEAIPVPAEYTGHLVVKNVMKALKVTHRQ